MQRISLKDFISTVEKPLFIGAPGVASFTGNKPATAISVAVLLGRAIVGFVQNLDSE